MTKGGELFERDGLLMAIGERGKAWINDNFESDGALVGGWAPLSEVTIARRRHGGDRPLQDTGNLRSSFDYEIRGDVVSIGTHVEYAPVHEFGREVSAWTDANGNVHIGTGIPQRRMIPNEKEGEELAMSLISAKLEQLRAS